ncbi:MAG: hypothetical protein KDK90_03890 [Leptospiraceae bacterium]|nr:hypothetical protein [Leptospiraceae bacterium]
MLLKFLIVFLSISLFYCIPTPFKSCKSHDFAFWFYWYLIWDMNQPPKNLTQEDISYESDKEIKYSNKLYLHGNTIAFSEYNYELKAMSKRHDTELNGIRFLDISNLENIKNNGFIKIPGSKEIAMKETTLFTDSYDDLASIDVSNIKSPKLNDLYLSVFYLSNNTYIPINTIGRKTCKTIYIDPFDFEGRIHEDSADTATAVVLPFTSKGSSISRFTIVDNRLFAVTYKDLIVFDISDVNNIKENNRLNITHDLNIETIYPVTNYLMLGAVNGIYIYNISDKDFPVYMSHIDHIVSCDPVVAEGNTAYVTLSSFGRNCRTGEDRLEIVDISDIENPKVIAQYDLDTPGSLAIDNGVLFVIIDTDGERKLEVLNVSDIENIQSYKTITEDTFIDIILDNGKAYALAQKGLYIYDYSDPSNIHQIGKYKFE